MRAADHCFGQNPIFARTPRRVGQTRRKLPDDAENELCERKFPRRGSRRALSAGSIGLPLPVCSQEHPTARFVAAKSPLYNGAESKHFVPPRSRPATNWFRFYSSVFSRANCLARNPRVREKDLDCNKDRAPKRSPNAVARSHRRWCLFSYPASHASKVLRKECKRSDNPSAGF